MQRRSLCQHLYKKLENIRNLSNEKYETVIKEFHRIMFSHKAEELETWIYEAKAHDIQELQSFLEGTFKDINAVKNGIIYPYSNCLAEGSVNKLKVLKRIMYGRNGFELLKAKILLYERMRL